MFILAQFLPQCTTVLSAATFAVIKTKDALSNKPISSPILPFSECNFLGSCGSGNDADRQIIGGLPVQSTALAASQIVPGQHTEPEIAPEGCFIVVRVNV